MNAFRTTSAKRAREQMTGRAFMHQADASKGKTGCGLCGQPTSQLFPMTVEGVTRHVCPACKSNGELNAGTTSTQPTN